MAGGTASTRLRGELARFRAALQAHRLSGFASPLEHARLRSEFTRLQAECARLGLTWRAIGDADDPGTDPLLAPLRGQRLSSASDE